MGTINYHTSDYITLGVNIDEVEEYNAFYYGEHGDKREVDYNSVQTDIEIMFEDIENTLSNYNLHYFHITIKPGYYEGFTLDIENNYCIAFDTWEDKPDAQKEITQIKKLLIECTKLGLVACCPGWCTGYKDYKGTIKAIKDAVKEMRAEVKNTPTWAQYERA